MKTLYKKEKLELRGTCIYYEVLMFNFKKFRIYMELSNGKCVGFNGHCCLSIMDDNGIWKDIVDNKEICEEYKEDLYYSQDTIEKDAQFKRLAKAFKDYIEKVYA